LDPFVKRVYVSFGLLGEDLWQNTLYPYFTPQFRPFCKKLLHAKKPPITRMDSFGLLV
jgi:hypothetical protein